MISRTTALSLTVGLVVVAGQAAAAAPSAEELVSRAVAAAETATTMDQHDMIRAAIRQEETASDGTAQVRDLTAIFHGRRLDSIRLELDGGVSLALDNGDGWAMIRGELDSRPQTPRMAGGTIRQTLFPLLMPFSLGMPGVELGAVTEGSFDGTPAWVLEIGFDADFFAAPSMVTTWKVFIGRTDHLVLGAEYLPAPDLREVRAEGIRYRVLGRQDVDGVSLPTQVLLDGIDLEGLPTGHVRVTKLSYLSAGPLDRSLFFNPAEAERLDAGEVE
ncbi:MAG: hypothetical protein MUC56_01375 [Thermoanaerobaculales bacterium]|nr:hypothetical protein [Thermoanaerobaculales bacterium]